MKVSLTILFFIILTHAVAQDGTISIDSTLNSVESLKQSKHIDLDSIEQKLSTATKKIQKLNDTLEIPSPQAEIDKQKNILQSKVDSLRSVHVPFEKYTQKLDSLKAIDPNIKLADVKNKTAEAQSKISNAESKVDAIQSKVNNLQSGPETKINEKLNVLSTESNGMGTLPSNVNIPGADLKTDGLPDTNINQPDLPSVKTHELALDRNALDSDIDLKIDAPKISQPEELEKVAEVQKKVDENLGEVTNKASGYTEDAKNISNGNIDGVKTLKEDAISKAGLDEEMGALKQGEAAIAEQKAALAAMKNQEAYKKQVLKRAKELAIKNVASHDIAIQNAVQKVNKYQKTAGTILQNKKDLPKKRDPLSKLKFYEKFVPGLTLQVNKKDSWMVDINPTLRYRLTSYWSIGSGWIERISIGDSQYNVNETRVYGVRSFSEVVIFKGISARVDVERINSFIIPFLQPQDTGERKWVWDCMAGLKKEFTFMPKVVGNVQFMYNLYDPNHYRIYPARFNVRFGFEFPLMKRNKEKTR